MSLDLIRREPIQHARDELSQVIQSTKQSLKFQISGIQNVIKISSSLADVLTETENNTNQANFVARENVSTNQKYVRESSDATVSMNTLEEDFKSVKKPLRAIEAIAKQTSLLALNPT